MKCCNSTRFIGCFDQCEQIDTGILAQQTGVHTIEGEFLEGMNSQQVIVTIGNPIIIQNIFNEFNQTRIRIIQPDGLVLIDGGQDCFIIKILPNITR